jgi:DNA invertase Pin-like site-specific DNA recombinase
VRKQKTDKRYDVIAVWKIDRFRRSLKHLANALADLDSLGVAFVSLRDNLNLSTPSGRLMFQVIGAMSEFERSLNSGARSCRAPQRSRSGCSPWAPETKRGCRRDRSTTGVRRFVA